MKQLACEMCGSTDLTKQDGVFVCQTCGCKYSLEDAKKMMIEGVVDVSGSTIKVDDTSKIGNYYTMAENAYDAGNKYEAEIYCNKIIEIDPTNYKAWLLKGKATGWQTTVYNKRINESINCFTKAIHNAPKDVVYAVKKESALEISQLSIALMKICCDNFAKFPSEDNEIAVIQNLKMVKMYSLASLAECGIVLDVDPNELSNNLALMMNQSVCTAWENIITRDYKHSEHPSKITWQTFVTRCYSSISIVTEAVNIVENLPDNIKQLDMVKANNITYYENLILYTTELVNSCSYTFSNGSYVRKWGLTNEAKQECLNNIMTYHQKVKEIDPSYVIPQITQKAKSNGCYVATAIYGSYDCPEVWTLRRYRDNQLAKTCYGRLFIHTYYAISPTIVKWFGNTEWFKKMWKGKLDKMVSDLQSKGIESTPYEDKEW